MALVLSWRSVFFSFTVVFVLLSLSFYLFFPMRTKYGHDHFIPYKQDLAKELSEISLQVKKLFMYKQIPTARLVQELEAVVKRLDNRRQLSSTVSDVVDKNGRVDVCPDEYKGAKFGYPYFATGWVITNCTNAKPIGSVISVLVNTAAYPKEDEKHIENVLNGITETYPTVKVYLATRSDKMMGTAARYENVHVVKVEGEQLGKGWNTLISKVSTPYVLIARDVFHFTWLTQIERQIRVISQIPDVVVAGGAYRNYSGHWKAGCVQTKLKNYVLEYQEGYYHSKNECMFCDYLQGPFVTKSNLLKFDESLPNEVIFEDWFLHVVKDGNLIMSCPDAMYFTTDYYYYSKQTDKNVWTPLAKKWELNRVLLPQGVKHSFSCQDIDFQCKPKSSFLLPVCCQEEYTNALSFLQKFADRYNVSFELDTGSVLGGVKFNGLLPWDIDGDTIALTPDIEIFNKSETLEYFEKNGYSLVSYESPSQGAGYVSIAFNGFDIEVWGISKMTNTQYLPPELQKRATFTKANIRGNWVNTAFSPGLFARNRYGREILKHSQSWREVNLPNSFADYDPGSFTPCEKPEHHACLQNFPVDGDIPFLVT